MVVRSLNGYATVKSYGLKGKLLSKKNFQMLAESRDIDELVTRLKNTYYADEVSKILKPYSSVKLEVALGGKQARLHYMLMNSTGGSHVLLAYYQKFIIRHLKIILKGKALKKPQEEIEQYINLDAEELIKQRDIVVKAMLVKDIDEAVASLKTIKFGDHVEKAFSIYQERKLAHIFDVYLDKIFYENLARVLKSSADLDLLGLFGMDLDFYNILGILRGKFWGLAEDQIQDLIVPHSSSTSKELLGRMISADSIRAALNELLSTKYKSIVPQEAQDIESIGALEHSFTLFINNALKNEFTKMFKFSTVVATARLYDYEVRNLAAISYGVEQKISTEIIMSKLILSE